MKIHIVLDEDPTPQQVTKGLQVMLTLAGNDVMGAAVKALNDVFEDEEDDGPKGPAFVPPPPATVADPNALKPAINTGEVDSTGLPWDARIHSSKKTTNKDGSWKARKNIDAAVVAAVTAELRAIPGVAAAPPPPAPPPPATAPVVIPPPPATVAAPAAPAPANDFVGVMQKITAGLSSGKLDQAKVSAALASVGLKQPLDLNSNPAQIPAVAAYLDAVMI